MELYREHLEIPNTNSKLLRLWNELEILTQLDNAKKISELTSIFPSLFTSDLYPSERVNEMSKTGRVDFYKRQRAIYQRMIETKGDK